MARTQKALINSVFGLIAYAVTLIMTLLSQSIFVTYLGYELLGINGVFTTIISTLNIAELGIGVAITFSLYKPMANDDHNKTALIIKMFRKVYSIIGVVVLIVGICIIPLMPIFVGDTFSFGYIVLIFSLFLSNAVLSYFFTYNHTILNADQKNFVLSLVTSITRLVMLGSQVLLLVFTRNYVLYLVVALICTVSSNIVVTLFVKKKYAYLNHCVGTLEKGEVKSIKKNIFSLMYHKIGNYMVTGTDNLIISAFLGAICVGYYSNYLIVSTAIYSLICNIFSGIVSGFGNLIAVSSKEYIYKVFRKVQFICFALFAVAACGVFVCVNILLPIVFTAETILSFDFLIFFVINFFITGYSLTLGNIRAAAGIFAPDRYLHILIALLNLCVSMILVNFIGITGVLVGTTLCLIIKECIVLPRIGCKYIYGGKPQTYYIRFILEFLLVVMMCALCWWIKSFIQISYPIIDFLVGCAICIAIPVSIISIIYFKTDEYKYYVNLFKRLVAKIFKKNKKDDKMIIEKTELEGVVVLSPKVFGDNRGWFTETYSKSTLQKNGINYDFIQDNHSFSALKGTLRGLHFQNYPYAQTKLVRCTRGSILDVAVDLRKGSPTFKKWIKVELSAENKKQLLIPKGFAHGFLTLTDDVEVQYKVDSDYSQSCDRSLFFADQEIGVEWGIDSPILSDKDKNAPTLKDVDCSFMKKVLVTGVDGQLGFDVMKTLKANGIECKGVDINDFDITDAKMTFDFIKEYSPDVVVHCSAYTAVDKAEECQEQCYSVNVEGSKNIASACKDINAKMVYISTDYVYDGKGIVPFEVGDKTNPISTYGKTKLQGELACSEILEKLFIVRTSWVFGSNGNNFVKTMLKIAKNNSKLKVVCDQIGSPTYTVDLAQFIFYILNTDKYGVYHCSNDGFTSWYEFAKAIFQMSGIDIEVEGIPTSEYKTLATRPLNSRLSKKCLIDCGYGSMPSWQSALDRYLKEISEEK